jgi:hypothetical protein
MTKMFSNLNRDGAEEATDRLGGNGPLPQGVYEATIKVAYVTESGRDDSDASCVNLELDIDGRAYREQLWVTNKNGVNTYADKQDSKKKHLLPGFVVVDDICLIVTGDDLSNQVTETRTLNIYNYEQKKDVPTQVPVLVDLSDQKILVAISGRVENKRKQNEQGVYVPTAETRSVNEIVKVADLESKFTVFEARNEVEEAQYMEAWAEKNDGKDFADRTVKVDGNTGRPGAGNSSAGNPGKKLAFGKNR